MAVKFKKYVSLFIVACFIVVVGCSLKHDAYQVSLSAGQEQPKPPESSIEKQDISNRFKENSPQNRSAVESAIEMSEKYAKLAEETRLMQQKNQNLENENKELKAQADNTRKQLEQNTKELNEANDLLMKTQMDLNNWKSDVIGFRDEMRRSEKAQLEALYKILVALGGEVKNPAEKTEPNNIEKPKADTDTENKEK